VLEPRRKHGDQRQPVTSHRVVDGVGQRPISVGQVLGDQGFRE
jgi:hypothetical protein